MHSFTVPFIAATLLTCGFVACGSNDSKSTNDGQASGASNESGSGVGGSGQASVDGATAQNASDGSVAGSVASATGGYLAPSSSTTGLGTGGTAGVAVPTGSVDETAQGSAGEGGALNGPTEQVATNPFVVTRHDPLSTFAADVDTASYDNFRRSVGFGTLPPPERVRLEEFVNYFAYDYPAPAADAELPFQIALSAAPSPYATGTTLLRVGIQGKQPPPLERKPTNLVFLIDVSGSMLSADKLPLVQQVLTETVDLLNDDDTISIVTYAGSTGVRLPPTPVSDKDAILGQIAGLEAGGSTAGAAGIDLAYQQAEAGYIEDGLNHVILCTDGDFNVGPSSTAELVDFIEQKRKSGVTLTVLGFGANNNDDLMEGISNAGNGVYGAITDSDQASRYVEERLLATLVHIAKDVKLQIEFNPQQVYAYRLLGYENRAIADEDFRDDAIDAGEIGSGHRVTALYELAVNDGTLPEAVGAPDTEDGAPYAGAVEVASDDWVLVKVRYKEPGASESDPAKEVSLSLSSDDLVNAPGAADADFRWAVAVAGFAEILKGSPYAPVDQLATIDELIRDEAYSSDPDKQEFVGLFTTARTLLE